MASTYTTNLALEKQANGENSNTWGTLLNAVLDQIEDAIATRLSLSVAGSANVTLTAAQALNMYQEYTGALTGNINVIVPSLDKVYFVFNNTSGAYTLTVKTSAGTGIAVTQGKRAILYCDTTNVVKMIAIDDAAADFLTTQGDLLFRGTSTIARLAVGGANSVLTANGTTVSWGTTITLGGGLTVNGTITAASLLDVAQSLRMADYVSIASGGTVNIGTALSNRISITGTTLITRLGTSSVGNFRELKFTAATPLGHDGTALILPGTATMTAANNDVADFISLGAGNWHCARYQKASGASVAAAASALQFVSTTTISNNATVDVQSLAAGYDYIFVLSALIPATDDITLFMRVEESSAWQADAADYTWSLDSRAGAESATTDSEIQLTNTTGTGMSNAANEIGAFEITWLNVGSAVRKACVARGGYILSGGTTNDVRIYGSYIGANGAVTGVRFLASSGNLTSGTLDVYRRQRS